jgi:3-hydroxyisobutyrate dehydrogenase-like beta-hydroxyacid dehydrogenase
MTAAGDRGIVAVLGLGEAGALIARDLVDAGVTVQAYDPVVPVPSGIVAAESDAAACRGAALVLSLTTAHEAEAAYVAARPGLAPGACYADLNTSSAGLKDRLGALAAADGVAFADVAMMAPVPGLGLRTPMLVSGQAAAAVAGRLNDLGGQAEVLPGPAGAAASRKLVRSVFYKGLAAAVVEALRAAEAAGCGEWLRANIAAELDGAGADTVDRLEQGSRLHAVRRTDEMAAAVALLGELGVPARVAAASRDWLAQLAHEAAGPTGRTS